MRYRTQRPATRSLLVFGVGITLAITQLGAGCVPASHLPCGPDAAVDDSGRCPDTGDGATNNGGDAK